MVTLEEIKNEVKNLQGQLAIFERFDEEIQKAKDDIQAIQNKSEDVQTFEDFQEIDAKQKYIADLTKQRKSLEVSKVGKIAEKARQINVSQYLTNELEQDTAIRKQRQEIKDKSMELIKLIENYNDNYKNTAQKIASEVQETGIQELFDTINSLPEYNRTSTNNLYCAVSGYAGDQSRYLSSSDNLGYLIKRINYFMED